MSKFVLQIDTNNAAFEDDPSREVRSILAGLVDRLRNDGGFDAASDGFLRDVNGTTVGSWSFEENDHGGYTTAPPADPPPGVGTAYSPLGPALPVGTRVWSDTYGHGTVEPRTAHTLANYEAVRWDGVDRRKGALRVPRSTLHRVQ